jgi:hypothetical protein
MSDQGDDGNVKQFALVVEQAAKNGYPSSVDYVDAHNPRMIGHASTINPPPPNYTYSALELRQVIDLLRKQYPNAQIEANEVAYIDHGATIERWSRAHRGWKISLGLDPDEPLRFG